MRRKLIVMLVTFMVIFVSNCFSVYAYIPSINGEVMSTDIIAYINNTPIKSYNVQDKTFIIAEDLRRYGFDVIWNEKDRFLTVTRIPGKTPDNLKDAEYKLLTTRGTLGKKLYDTYETDISVFLEGVLVSSGTDGPDTVNVDGQTLINLNILGTYYGTLQWDEESRTIHLSIENDFAACRSDFTKEKISITKSFGKPIRIGNHSADYGLHVGMNVRGPNNVNGDFPIYSIIVTLSREFPNNLEGYFQFDSSLIEELGISCEIKGNMLTIHAPQYQKDIRIGSLFTVMTQGCVSYVDLQLISNGREINDNTTFPVFLSIDGKLYIKASSLAEALGLDSSNYSAFIGGSFTIKKWYCSF